METTCQLKCVEKIHLRKNLWLKINILPFFLPKIHMTSKLRQNAAVIFLSTATPTPIKLFQQYLLFARKNANKDVAFLNVLSVYHTIVYVFVVAVIYHNTYLIEQK